MYETKIDGFLCRFTNDDGELLIDEISANGMTISEELFQDWFVEKIYTQAYINYASDWQDQLSSRQKTSYMIQSAREAA